MDEQSEPHERDQTAKPEDIDAGSGNDLVKSLDHCNPYPQSLMSIMSSSQYGQVIFHDIYDIYPTDGDLYFHYTLTETVKPRSGDRIGLYKVGWAQISEIFTSIPGTIPMIDREQQHFCTLRSSFPASSLPKEEDELYQLCYLTFDNKVAGASTPFAFRRPHESDICSVESPGMVVYKSRIAVLHNKIAALEDSKEEGELKVFTLNKKMLIMQKELTSINSLNSDLSVELKNAKEDVRLLTDNLKRLKDELQKLKVEFKIIENGFHAAKVENEELNLSLREKDDELQHIKNDFNCVKEEHLHAELKLVEVTDYNIRLKKDVDSLKQEKESLIVIEQKLKKEISQVRLSQQQQQQQQQQTNRELLAGGTIFSPSTNNSVESLQAQLEEVLHILDETLQNQSSEGRKEIDDLLKTKEELTKTIVEKDQHIGSLGLKLLKSNEDYSKLKNELENQKKVVLQSKEETNHELQDIITEQYQEIQRLTDKLILSNSKKEEQNQKEKELLEEVKMLALAKDSASKMSESLALRLNAVEDELKKCRDEFETENIAILKTKITELEQVRSDLSIKVEESENIIRCLREALLRQPTLEELCKIIFESTRITAMDTYNELFDSVQFLEFDNAEYGIKVRRVLDEFAVLKQYLDRCRLENQTICEQHDQLESEFNKVQDENEFNKNKVVELNEIISEMSNCLQAIKKESNDIVKNGSSDVQFVKEIKEQLENVKAKNEVLENQLKEVKITNALTNIGRVTVDESSLMTEVEQLRSRVVELETQILNSSDRKSFVKMQEQLKQSAKEYARLYHQMQTERQHYEKLVASINSFQCTSSSPLPELGQSTSQSSS